MADKPNIAEAYDLDLKAEAAAPVAETPAAKPEAPKSTHPAYLVELAKDIGLTQGEIDCIPTDTLGAMCRRTIGQIKREQPRPAETTQPTVTTPSFEDEDLLAVEDVDDDGKPKKFSSSDFHKSISGAFKRLQKEFADFKKQFAEVRDVQQVQVVESNTKRIDKVFTERADIFGSGSASEVDRASAEGIRRMAVVNLVREDKSHTSLEAKVKKAVETLYGATTVKTEAPKPKPAAVPPKPNGTPRITEEDWNASTLQKPTHRDGAKEPPGRNRAIAAVESLQREQAADVGESNGPTTIDEFPG